MAELRYHPLTGDWVMIASHRQARPQMPKGYCPFCPGSGKVPPEGYEVLRYPNDFPALSTAPPVPDLPDVPPLFRTAPSYGRCEVLLYSPEHEGKLRDLSDAHMAQLAGMWRECFDDMAADPNIRYAFLFENRGETVGVTMPHPHGQAYGYPFIPKKIELEVENAKKYRAQTGHCLFCDILAGERQDGRRIIFERDGFTVYLPFFTEYPYGVYIMPHRHAATIADLTETELAALGVTVKKVVGMFDMLWSGETGTPSDFPYMMCMHNAPVDGGGYADDYHLHIEFFPPMRAADKLKFNASSETGVWAHCNPTAPEEKAVELREAYARFIQTQR